MSSSAQNLLYGITAARMDLHNADQVVQGVIAGKTPAKNPRAAVLEYIGSAAQALKEARKEAKKLPTRNS